VADEIFWNELLSYLRRGELVPIAGPDLNVVTSDHADHTLTELIARRLVDSYALDVPLARMTMGEATAMVIRQHGREEADGLYRVVSDIIAEFDGSWCAPLRELAAITDFRLYISTTPDTLLAEAINDVRYGGTREVCELTFFPNQSTRERALHLVAPGDGDIAVVRLFGRAASTDQYAIHEEDLLEWLHSLLSDSGGLPEWIMHRLRQQPLLFIGCEIPDWLGRFLLRLSSDTRLSTKGKPFYLVSTANTAETPLANFFATYCRSMRIRQLHMAPTDFVFELHQRWRADLASRKGRSRAGARVVPLSPDAPKFFISYAREDIDCARRLSDYIRSIGGEVFLDERRLRPGDEWWPEIRREIDTETDLFLAILSANTEKRTEGYVFREWRTAIKRSYSMLNQSFIIPVMIERWNKPTDYRQVPDEFRDLHFGFAPDCEPDESLRLLLRDVIRAKWRQSGIA
jgi:hypothetical protein